MDNGIICLRIGWHGRRRSISIMSSNEPLIEFFAIDLIRKTLPFWHSTATNPRIDVFALDLKKKKGEIIRRKTIKWYLIFSRNIDLLSFEHFPGTDDGRQAKKSIGWFCGFNFQLFHELDFAFKDLNIITSRCKNYRQINRRLANSGAGQPSSNINKSTI